MVLVFGQIRLASDNTISTETIRAQSRATIICCPSTLAIPPPQSRHCSYHAVTGEAASARPRRSPSGCGPPNAPSALRLCSWWSADSLGPSGMLPGPCRGPSGADCLGPPCCGPYSTDESGCLRTQISNFYKHSKGGCGHRRQHARLRYLSEVQKPRDLDLDLGSGQGHINIHSTCRTTYRPNHVTVALCNTKIWPFECRKISILDEV